MDDFSETFANQWFSVTFVWKNGLLTQTDLSAELKAATAPRSPHGPALERIVAKFANLDADEWPDLPLDRRNLSPFTLVVLENLRLHTPRGSFTTYGQLAARCGSPRGARAVGGVMAEKSVAPALSLPPRAGGKSGAWRVRSRNRAEKDPAHSGKGSSSGLNAGRRNSSSTTSASSA